jgi:hypothetical protein
MNETYGLLLPFWDSQNEDDARCAALTQWRAEAAQVGEVVGEPEADLLSVMQHNGKPLVLHDDDGNAIGPTKAWRVTGQVVRHEIPAV